MNKKEHNTEAKILTAAQEVFVKEGYDGARMQQIADHAGINKALLHYYFRSKAKLYNEVINIKMREFIPKVGAIFFSDKTLLEKLNSLVDQYLELLQKNPKLPAFIINSVNRDPQFVEKIPSGIFEAIETYFIDEIEKGNINRVDPRQFLLSFVSMCVFPFAARPLGEHLFQMKKEEYDTFLSQRSEAIKKYIGLILKPS